MGVFISPRHDVANEMGHEQVVFCQDSASGLKAIIAIYSTALGPALGGTRFYPYPSEDAALADVLQLSRAMAYKNSLAGLDLGGGKAVIWGDPATIKTEALLRAYGRFVHSLGGRYVTACDVGTYTSDMDTIARETPHVVGRSLAAGGGGDSSILTAWGVFQAIRACAQHRWGSDDLTGKRIGIAGVGKVGSHLTTHAIAAGAHVTVTDPDPLAVKRLRDAHPEIGIAADTHDLTTSDIDIYAPCALGQALDDETVNALRAAVVAGAANNQLAHPGVEKLLADRGILYAPDYVVNSGGVIQVADEIAGFDFDRAKARATGIFDTTLRILQLAERDGVTPVTAANHLAEDRMDAIGRLRGIRLTRDR